jgi:tetratricopeptide (TPR) repeat protein
MSNAKLKTQIKRLVKEQLSQEGFSLSRLRIPERTTAELRQGIEFQPGTGHLSGQYTLNVYWSFRFFENDGAMDGCRRIGDLLGCGDTWFSREDDKLDSEFVKVTQLIMDHAVPYLNAHNTIQKIIAAHENEDLSTAEAFGEDVGWQQFNLGFCYDHLGQNEEALAHLSRVIEEHSDEDYEWVQERKQMALNRVTRISASQQAI